MKLGILVIGEELLHGHQQDSNTPVLSQFLLHHGLRTRTQLTCGDEVEAICEALELFPQDISLVICSGGLGGTRDDCTPEALKQWQGLDTLSLLHTLNNSVGMASGLVVEKQGRKVIALPGVPKEFVSFMNHELLEIVTNHFQINKKTAGKHLNIYGLTEREIDRRLGEHNGPFGNPRIGITAKEGFVRLHLLAEAEKQTEADELLRNKEKDIQKRLHPHVYGEGQGSIEELIAGILKEKQLSLSTAESCTGGLLADRLTNIPGASTFFSQALVTYSIESKIQHLGIDKKLIKKEGVVSEAVARAMAENMRNIANSDFAIGVTGNLGPTTNEEGSELGLVHMAVSSRQQTWHQKHHLKGNRLSRKHKAAVGCFQLLLKQLQDIYSLA